VRAELKKRGYDSELVGVDVLGSLVGLNLSDPNVGETVLAACRVRLAEPGKLLFNSSHRIRKHSSGRSPVYTGTDATEPKGS